MLKCRPIKFCSLRFLKTCNDVLPFDRRRASDPLQPPLFLQPATTYAACRDDKASSKFAPISVEEVECASALTGTLCPSLYLSALQASTGRLPDIPL